MDPKWTQNGPKMDLKWTQNGPKMDPKWTQNGPKMDPKWTQNGPRMDPKWTRSLTHILTHLELDTHISEDHPSSSSSPGSEFGFRVRLWLQSRLRFEFVFKFNFEFAPTLKNAASVDEETIRTKTETFRGIATLMRKNTSKRKHVTTLLLS